MAIICLECLKTKKIDWFDPSPLTLHQFEFINHFVKSDIVYEMLELSI